MRPAGHLALNLDETRHTFDLELGDETRSTYDLELAVEGIDPRLKGQWAQGVLMNRAANVTLNLGMRPAAHLTMNLEMRPAAHLTLKLQLRGLTTG